MGVFRREQKTEASPYGVQRALTASAKKLGKKQITQLATGTIPFREWQREAWVGYDAVGEIHYGFSVVGNTLSRIRVYAAAITTTDEVPVPLDEDDGKNVNSEVARMASELMYSFTSTDFASMMRAFALNMSVPGECYLIDIGKESPKWAIKSVDEVKIEADKISLVPRADLASTTSPDRILAKKTGQVWDKDLAIGRIWRQHPRYSEEPDSSMKAIADPIEELLLLGRLVRSTTRARLNNGIVFIPEGVTTASSVEGQAGTFPDEEGVPTAETASSDQGNSLLAELIDSAMTPIEDESAPSSVVPLMLTGPGEAGQQIRHITFERSSDQWLADRAERALERILQGIDIPKEIVTGLQNVKYSNAIAITEDFWKSNIEPLAIVFADAVTEIFLRPSLVAMGVDPEDAARVTVWYDPSEIVTRPNHADDATLGYDRSMLSADAWRREHGFSTLDKPDEAELAMQLLMSKLPSLPEDVAATLLQIALPKLLGKQRDDNLAAQAIPFPDAATNILSGNQPAAAPPAAPASDLNPNGDTNLPAAPAATETAA